MKSNYTHLSMLLDRSGSMESIKTDIIGGFNNFISEQKKEQGELTVTLAQFDSESYDLLNDFSPIDKVTRLDEKNFQPRASTPLNDSLAKLIIDTGNKLATMEESNRPEKVIVIVMTDGYENASKEQTKHSIKAMIERQEKDYSWKFVYLGANQDSFAEGNSRGIASTMNFAASKAGTTAMYASLSSNVSNARNMSVNKLKAYNLSADLKKDYEKIKKELEEKENE